MLSHKKHDTPRQTCILLVAERPHPSRALVGVWEALRAGAVGVENIKQPRLAGGVAVPLGDDEEDAGLPLCVVLVAA